MEVTEQRTPDIGDPNDEIVNSLANNLLWAHGDPEMIRRECMMLLEDSDELDLHIIRDYVAHEILPGNGKGFELSTWIGDFGEVLAAQFLIELEDYWFPIYKLRFREKRRLAMKLTDLCLIKTKGLPVPLICFGEVKTRSSQSKCNLNLGVEGHESLKKDDALDEPEILKFVCSLLYSMMKFDEAMFLSRLRLDKASYTKKHTLFLIHEASTWDDRILKNLHVQELDPRLTDFSVRVVLVKQLRQLIDESYARAWQGVVPILQ